MERSEKALLQLKLHIHRKREHKREIARIAVANVDALTNIFDTITYHLTGMSAVRLVSDVLALIATSFTDHEAGDMRAFRLVCTHWNQSVMDNAHFWDTKLWVIKTDRLYYSRMRSRSLSSDALSIHKFASYRSADYFQYHLSGKVCSIIAMDGIYYITTDGMGYSLEVTDTVNLYGPEGKLLVKYTANVSPHRQTTQLVLTDCRGDCGRALLFHHHMPQTNRRNSLFGLLVRALRPNSAPSSEDIVRHLDKIVADAVDCSYDVSEQQLGYDYSRKLAHKWRCAIEEKKIKI